MVLEFRDGGKGQWTTQIEIVDPAGGRMRAESTAIGVHEVTLRATTVAGDPIGSEVQFNVRTSNVGFVIWLVMGVGGGLLLVAIVWRIVRRVRDRRTPDTAEADADEELTEVEATP